MDRLRWVLEMVASRCLWPDAPGWHYVHVGPRSTERGDRLRVWLLAVLAVMFALLTAALAAATNLATELAPAGWRWAHDSAVLWGAVGVLAVVVAVLSAVQQRLAGRGDALPATVGTRRHVAAVVGHEALRRGSGAVGLPERASNLPPRNPNFTGRDVMMRTVRQILRRSPAAVVVAHGLGGIGKTQLALEFAHQAVAEGRYELVWWIRAESSLTVKEDLAALAPVVDVPAVADQEATVMAVLRELVRRDGWLLVFDNARDSVLIRPWLPMGAGHTLITSRDPRWGDLAARIDLAEFTRTESVAYLQRRSQRADAAAADALAAELGDLPLALAQAAAYLESHGHLSITGYLERYRDHTSTGKLLAAGMNDYPHSVATTWLIHLRELTRHPAALQLLRLCAHLNPDRIDVDQLLARPDLFQGRRTAALARAAAQPDQRRRLVDVLAGTGLATRLDDDHEVRLHRLVAQVTRHHLAATSRRWWLPARSSGRGRTSVGAAWARLAVTVLDGLFPTDPREPDTWPACADLVAHITTAVDLAAPQGPAENSAPVNAVAGQLLRQLGGYLSARGEYAAALTAFQRALALTEATYGRDDAAVAATLNDLGSVQHDAGRIDEALASLQRALQIKEDSSGPYHPTVAITLTNLGDVQRDLGRIDDALESLQRARQIKEAMYGSDHVEVAYALTNLGVVQQKTGQAEAGLASLQRALWICETVHGPDHPRVAVTLNSLGIVQHAIGQPKAALANLRRALRINEALYGPDHPRVAVTLNNLGIVEHELGNRESASASLQRALQIKETQYGPDHRQTRAVQADT